MYRTIIVEDDPMVAAINKDYLAQDPRFALTGTFANGAEALDHLKARETDLAIVDYYMPLMDGAAFLQQLRADGLDTGVIMITAANAAQEISFAMRHGIVDYIIKPFTRDRFQSALDKYVTYQNTLREQGPIDQETLDHLLQPSPAIHTVTPAGGPVKGIQDKTLSLLMDHLKARPDALLSCDEIARDIGLSRITVRRYLNYLVENGALSTRIDYLTGGRPSIRYQLKTGQDH